MKDSLLILGIASAIHRENLTVRLVAILAFVSAHPDTGLFELRAEFGESLALADLRPLLLFGYITQGPKQTRVGNNRTYDYTPYRVSPDGTRMLRRIATSGRDALNSKSTEQ